GSRPAAASPCCPATSARWWNGCCCARAAMPWPLTWSWCRTMAAGTVPSPRSSPQPGPAGPWSRPGTATASGIRRRRWWRAGRRMARASWRRSTQVRSGCGWGLQGWLSRASACCDRDSGMPSRLSPLAPEVCLAANRSGEECVLELVKAGGWPMIPLLLLSGIALAIIIERFWTLRRNSVLPPGLGDEVRAWVSRGGALEPAHLEQLCETAPLGALLAAALDVRKRPRDQVRERIEDTGRHLVHRMEKFLNTLGTIAAAGPLLGLFGTVVGMIQLFLGILD